MVRERNVRALAEVAMGGWNAGSVVDFVVWNVHCGNVFAWEGIRSVGDE